MVRQVGDVAEGFVIDLPVLAVGTADQGGAAFHGGVGLVGALVAVDGYVVHCGALGAHSHNLVTLAVVWHGGISLIFGGYVSCVKNGSYAGFLRLRRKTLT